MARSDPVENVPRASIIIPSLDDSRKHLLDALLNDLKGQTLQDYELRIIQGDRRQGRAINRGVAEAQGRTIVILDDDTRLATDDVIERVVVCVESDDTIGMAGASTLVPDWANALQRRAMNELPRRTFPLVEEVTDSDMAQHPCCAMRKDVFLEIGGEREDIVRGLDPYLRQAIRDHGYRVVIAPQCGIYHMLPETWAGLMRMALRNGVGSAYAQRTQPDLIYETGDGLDESFDRQVGWAGRMARYPMRMVAALCQRRFILFCWLWVYLVGYIRCYLWGWKEVRDQNSDARAPRDQ